MRAPTVCAFDDGAFDVDTERADVGIGPYDGSGRRGCVRTRRCGPGGHTGRPYGVGNGAFSGEISVDGIGIVL